MYDINENLKQIVNDYADKNEITDKKVINAIKDFLCSKVYDIHKEVEKENMINEFDCKSFDCDSIPAERLSQMEEDLYDCLANRDDYNDSYGETVVDIFYAYNGNEEKLVRCNNCMHIFLSSKIEKLEREENENKCPDCDFDGSLMDITADEAFKDIHINNGNGRLLRELKIEDLVDIENKLIDIETSPDTLDDDELNEVEKWFLGKLDVSGLIKYYKNKEIIL